MKQPPVKRNWIDKCVDIYNFHITQLKEERNWTVEKTAAALNRSIGSVSQDLTIATWLRTHEKQIRKFTCAKDALEFIKNKKREMKVRELEL